MWWQTLTQLICATIPFGLGLSMVFFRNAWWRWQERQSEQRGWQISERNQFWDVMMIALGILFVLISIFLILKLLAPSPVAMLGILF